MKELLVIFISLFLSLPVLTAKNILFVGTNLERSTQNESNAAIDRAVEWLFSQQNEKGYWGDEDLLLTSAATLAITSSNAENLKNKKIEKAVDWLKTSTNAPPQKVTLGGLYWRNIVLAILAPEISLPTPFVKLLKFKKNVYASCLVQNLRKSPYDTTPPSYTNDLVYVSYTKTPDTDGAMKKIAEDWSAQNDIPKEWKEDAELAWWYANAINRVCNGEIYLKSNDTITPIDWRVPLANHWTTTQTMDSNGRGNWKNSVLETSFAVLLLNEL